MREVERRDRERKLIPKKTMDSTAKLCVTRRKEEEAATTLCVREGKWVCRCASSEEVGEGRLMLQTSASSIFWVMCLRGRCACVRACVRVCVRACVREREMSVRVGSWPLPLGARRGFLPRSHPPPPTHPPTQKKKKKRKRTRRTSECLLYNGFSFFLSFSHLLLLPFTFLLFFLLVVVSVTHPLSSLLLLLLLLLLLPILLLYVYPSLRTDRSSLTRPSNSAGLDRLRIPQHLISTQQPALRCPLHRIDVVLVGVGACL